MNIVVTKSVLRCLAVACLAVTSTTQTVHAAAFDPTDPNNGAINPGYPVSADANAGGQTVITQVYIPSTTYVDSPLTVTQNNYSVTIEAELNGSTSVYDQTFSAAYSDASVQTAVSDAEAALRSNGATSLIGPTLTSSSTASTGQQTTYTQTGSSTTTTDATGELDLFGPATSFNQVVGLNTFVFEPTFTVLGGQLDLISENEVATPIDRNAVTTNTFLTTQNYLINGTSVPEPAEAGIAAVAGGLLLSIRRRSASAATIVSALPFR